MISGFTFIHNAIKAGIPIRESINAVLPYVDEMVVIDAESNDGTRELLEQMGSEQAVCKKYKITNTPVRIIDAKWGTDGGETLKRLHAMNVECEGDTIVHFEADEVYDEGLLDNLLLHDEDIIHNYSFYRLQVEQNFQRIRWYPELVHRIFPRGTVEKVGHTTNSSGTIIDPSHGFIWDVTNCFRDNWVDRVEQQAELRKDTETPYPNLMRVPLHFTQRFDLVDIHHGIKDSLKEDHWTWTETPLNIPDILKPLVGKTKYE